MSITYEKLNHLVQAKIAWECAVLMMQKGVEESIFLNAGEQELQKLFEEYLTSGEIDEIIDNVHQELLEMSAQMG